MNTQQTRLNRRPSRSHVLVLVATIALGLAGGALAYWAGAGAGAATTELGNPSQLTLTPGSPEAQLSPGHNSSVTVIATNPNPYFVEVPSLSLDTSAGTGGFDVDAGHSECDLSVLHFAPQDNGGAGWSVPPKVDTNDGSRVIGLDASLSMDLDAASACQGATFTVHLTEAG